jgi:endonuclease YncB( thermonuclease family)
MVHDFKRFPELTNNQMTLYYWESPHKQITDNFHCQVVKVVDGDTVNVKWSERDFTFPVRFANTNAPEMSEGGEDAKRWMTDKLQGKNIEVRINPAKRVGKYGRILGNVIFGGMDVGEESIINGHATPFTNRDEGEIPNIKWVD